MHFCAGFLTSSKWAKSSWVDFPWIQKKIGLKKSGLGKLTSLYKSACLSVSLFGCLFLNSSKTANPSKPKFWGMIPLGLFWVSQSIYIYMYVCWSYLNQNNTILVYFVCFINPPKVLNRLNWIKPFKKSFNS